MSDNRIEGDPATGKQNAVGHSMSKKDRYNAVSDLATGVNLRKADNLLQAGAIVACIFLGGSSGALFAPNLVTGAVLGGLIGMLVGLFGSGIFLMIFRGLMHWRGRHD